MVYHYVVRVHVATENEMTTDAAGEMVASMLLSAERLVEEKGFDKKEDEFDHQIAVSEFLIIDCAESKDPE